MSRRSTSVLESAWVAPVLGVLTALATGVVWGSLIEPGIVHDERAYLLQAEIFARGHWTASAPPLAEFFEQMHVFVSPAVFAKYPPGHALALVPGIWFGLPGLMPVVMMGIAGALTFHLARRFANAKVAVLTWLTWTTAPATLAWGTSYLSQTTSTVMWLVALSAVVAWLDGGKERYLVGAAAAVAWGASTRPLTTAALVLPLAAIVVKRLLEMRRPRAVLAPLAVGAAIFAVLGPVWNWQTLGSWRLDPYSHYSRTYFPFDKPGFGVDPTPPLRPLPAELAGMDALSRTVHQAYVPAAIPAALAARAAALWRTVADGWRLVLGVLLLAGLAAGSPAARFIGACAAMLFGAYLCFAHPPGWVVYYFELLPALHFVAAVVLMQLLERRGGPRERSGRMLALPPATTAAVLLLVPFCTWDLVRVHGAIDHRNLFQRRLARAVAAAPPHSIVFVRLPPAHDPNYGVTRNEADLATARSWLVPDRGDENARLAALAPDRATCVFDVGTLTLEPLSLGGIDQ